MGEWFRRPCFWEPGGLTRDWMKEFHCLAFLSLFRHQNSTHKRIFADNEVLIAGLSRFSTPPLYVQPQAMQRANYPENSQEGAKAKFNKEIQVKKFLGELYFQFWFVIWIWICYLNLLFDFGFFIWIWISYLNLDLLFGFLICSLIFYLNFSLVEVSSMSENLSTSCWHATVWSPRLIIPNI